MGLVLLVPYIRNVGRLLIASSNFSVFSEKPPKHNDAQY